MNNMIDYELEDNTTYQDLYKIHTGHRLNGFTDESDASSDSSISSYNYLRPPPYSYEEISQNLVVIEASSEDESNGNWQTVTSKGYYKTRNLQTFRTKAKSEIKHAITPITSKKKYTDEEIKKCTITPMEILAQKLSLLITKKKCLICKVDGKQHYRREGHYKSVITWLETQLKKNMLPVDITFLFCKICNLPLTGNEEAKKHYETVSHREKTKSFCVPCLRVIEEHDMASHCNSKKHLEHIDLTFNHPPQSKKKTVQVPPDKTQRNETGSSKSYASVLRNQVSVSRAAEKSKLEKYKKNEVPKRQKAAIATKVQNTFGVPEEIALKDINPLAVLLRTRMGSNYCHLCNETVYRIKQSHYRTKQHYQVLTQWIATHGRILGYNLKNIYLVMCFACNFIFPNVLWAQEHYKSIEHKKVSKHFCNECMVHENSETHKTHKRGLIIPTEFFKAINTKQEIIDDTKENNTVIKEQLKNLDNSKIEKYPISHYLVPNKEQIVGNKIRKRSNITRVDPNTLIKEHVTTSHYADIQKETPKSTPRLSLNDTKVDEIKPQWREFSSKVKNRATKTVPREGFLNFMFPSDKDIIENNLENILDKKVDDTKVISGDAENFFQYSTKNFPLTVDLKNAKESMTDFSELTKVKTKKPTEDKEIKNHTGLTMVNSHALTKENTKENMADFIELTKVKTEKYLIQNLGIQVASNKKHTADKKDNHTGLTTMNSYGSIKENTKENMADFTEQTKAKTEKYLIQNLGIQVASNKKHTADKKDNHTGLTTMNSYGSIKENTKENMADFTEQTKAKTEKYLIQNLGIQVASNKKHTADKKDNHTGLTTMNSYASTKELLTTSNYADIRKDTPQNPSGLSVNNTNFDQIKNGSMGTENSYSNVTLFRLGLKLNKSSIEQDTKKYKEHMEQCENIFKKFDQLTKKLETVPLEACLNFLDHCNRDINEIYSNNIILDKNVDDTKVISDDAENGQNDCSEKISDNRMSHLNLKQEIDKLKSLTETLSPTFSYFAMNKLNYLVMYVRNFTSAIDSLQSEQTIFRIENVFQYSPKHFPVTVDFCKYDFHNDVMHYEVCKMSLIRQINSLEQVILSNGNLNLNLKYLSEFSTKLNKMYNNYCDYGNNVKLRKAKADLDCPDDCVQSLENHKLDKFSTNNTNTWHGNSDNSLNRKYKTEAYSDFESAEECCSDDNAHTSQRKDYQKASCTLI